MRQIVLSGLIMFCFSATAVGADELDKTIEKAQKLDKPILLYVFDSI